MSTYTGTVTPGGPTDVRELPGLVIRKASVGPQDNNAYLLTCRETGERLLVDAADDAATLLGRPAVDVATDRPKPGLALLLALLAIP